MYKWITGGRPMRYERAAFIDKVDGRMVCYYVDRFKRRWLAHHAWSLFRMLSANQKF